MSGLSNQFPADNFTLIALVLALPLLGAIFNGLFGKRMGNDAVRSMGLWAIGGAFVASVTTFLMVATAEPAAGQKMVRFTWNAWHWFDVADRFRQPVPIDVAFSVDALSATMMLVVTGVGWLIHLYSTGYLSLIHI